MSINNPIDLDNVDPLKLDFAMDIRQLSREIVLTVKISDDKLFSELSTEGEVLFKEAMAEFKRIKQDIKDGTL